MKRFKTVGLCLMVVCAFSAVVASGASAHLYGTELGGTFTGFAVGTPEMVVSHGTGTFLLLSVATPVKGIECKLLLDTGFYTNLVVGTEMVGHSEDELDFHSCTPVNLSGCSSVNPKAGNLINGHVTDEISKNGKKVKVTVTSGFNVKCVIAGEEVELGNVTGSSEGTVVGDVLEFVKAGGLTFFGNASTITGNDLAETLGGMPVVIQ